MKVEIKKRPKFEPVKMEITIDDELDYDSLMAAIREFELDGVIADSDESRDFHEEFIRAVSVALNAAKNALA